MTEAKLQTGVELKESIRYVAHKLENLSKANLKITLDIEPTYFSRVGQIEKEVILKASGLEISCSEERFLKFLGDEIEIYKTNLKELETNFDNL